MLIPFGIKSHTDPMHKKNAGRRYQLPTNKILYAYDLLDMIRVNEAL